MTAFNTEEPFNPQYDAETSEVPKPGETVADFQARVDKNRKAARKERERQRKIEDMEVMRRTREQEEAYQQELEYARKMKEGINEPPEDPPQEEAPKE